MRQLTLWISAAAAAITLAACGGGGDSTPATATATSTSTSTTITGNAVKGPVNGATVTIKNAASGAVLVTTTTSVTGAYSVATAFAGDVIVEVSGGSYIDEASGRTTTLAAPMRTVVTAGGGTVTGMVTPLTTMAYTYSGSAAPTAAAFSASATKIASQLGLTTGTNIVTTLPSVSGTTNDYGMALRALSQYLQNNPGVSLNSLMSTAMASTTYATFSAAYSSAYSSINGKAITVSFTGANVITISGTGATGTADCGVAISLNGASLLNYCYQGLPADACSANNASLNAALSAVAVPGVGTVKYTFSNTCAPGALTIKLT